jgi:serine/threonine protein kinase
MVTNQLVRTRLVRVAGTRENGGYLAPEGPGTTQADLYSLGKVLYEISTGLSRREFPALPEDIATAADRQHLSELNAVVVKACQVDPVDRYVSAEDMRQDLALLHRGRSVRRKRIIHQRLVFSAKVLSALAVTGLLLIGGFFFRDARNSSPSQHKRTENPEVARLCKLGRFHYYKITDEGFAKAMEYFNKALELDSNSVEAYVGIADLCNVAQSSTYLLPKAAKPNWRLAPTDEADRL